jgi:serine/threonine-protein kinase
MPDRRPAPPDTEERESRRSPWTIAALFALLAIGATAAGYVLFAKPFAPLAGGAVVGDYTGMTLADAQDAIVNAGLRTTFMKTASETVPADHIIRQSPLAGTKVEKNQLVELIVSNGKPLRGLNDVRGFNVNDAQRSLQQDGFAVTIVHRFDPTIKDNVIGQLPRPGAKVADGSRVTLIVSDGPKPIVMPNFVNMTLAAARTLADARGITLDASQSVPGTPPDTIASQSVPYGTVVDRNTIVRVVVNSGAPMASPASEPNGPIVPLPSVVNADFASAQKTLTQAGFVISVRYAQQSSNNGTIVAQDPPAGEAPQGSKVTVTLSVSGEVPDTEGMTAQGALNALESYGYSVGKWQYTTSAGAGGKVIGTDPSAGTALAPGSSVTVIVNGTPPP